MEDLIYLIARHTVHINVENRSMGTSNKEVSFGATVIAENDGRKLTAYSHIWGAAEKTIELREEAVRGALARLRRQVEALEALK